MKKLNIQIEDHVFEINITFSPYRIKRGGWDTFFYLDEIENNKLECENEQENVRDCLIKEFENYYEYYFKALMKYKKLMVLK